MSTRSRLSLVCLVVLSSVCSLGHAGHINHHHAHHVQLRHLHHRHHVRQEASPIFAGFTLVPTPTEPALPSITAGDAVSDDIEQIQAGMNNFTEDLASFFRAIEQWLQAFKSILANDLSPETIPTQEPGPVIPAVIPSVTSSITYHQPVPVLTSTSKSVVKSTSSLCRPPAGAGPLVPCPEPQTTGFITVTSTSTRSNTITTYHTILYPNISAPANGTAVTPLPTAVPIPALNSTLSTATLTSYAPTSTPQPYTFNATSIDNIAVYYGTTLATTPGGLLALCDNPNVDIVILSFISDFFSASNYPTLNFGPACTNPAPAQRATAPGLKDCSALAPEIQGCQSLDKKVLVSLGGWGARSAFASEEQAMQFAGTLWSLFGPGFDNDLDLRPFGPDPAITVDGFDIDNEDHSTAYWDVFVATLRAHIATDPSKRYYLSAAPQCPRPDASIPAAVLAQMDFVWVQFYNNPSCDLDAAGFQASFASWSADLATLGGEEGGPRLFVGVPGFAGAGSGYVEGAALYSRVTQARELDAVNFGGVMVWDGSEAVANVDGYGVDYLSYAKDALHL